MPNAADDGHGATLTLGTSSWDTTALITSIQCDPVKRDVLKTSHLTTSTYHSFIPEDLVDAGGFTIEFYSDGDAEPPILDVPETVTVTYPKQGSYSTGSLITGTGFCDEYTPAQFQVGELVKGSAHFKWAGTVTYTDHT